MAHMPHFGEKIVAIADIESGSAGVAIIVLHGSHPPKILAHERRVLPYEERTTEATIAGIMAKLSEAGETALASYHAGGHTQGRVSLVFVIMRAPWTRSKTVRITSKLGHDEIITDNLIGDLAQKAISEDAEFDRTNVFETYVVRVELNGYPCAVPLGKTAHEISVVTLMSHCDPGIRTGVQSTLSRIFPSCTPVLRSGTRAFMTAINSTATPQKYLLIDVGSTCTSVASLQDGLALEYALIPEGTRTILERIAHGGLPEETLSILRMIGREDCTSDACNTMRGELARIEPELVRVYGETMGKIAIKYRLPNDLILVADPDFAPWLASFFARIDFTQFTTTTQPFAVTALAPETLVPAFLNTTTRDLDLGLAAAVKLVNIESREQETA